MEEKGKEKMFGYVDNHGPLILVFYILRDTLMNHQIRESYMSSIQKFFDEKGDNVRLFFIPTDTEERLECLNPRYIEDKDVFNRLVNDLEKIKSIFDVKHTDEEK